MHGDTPQNPMNHFFTIRNIRMKGPGNICSVYTHIQAHPAMKSIPFHAIDCPTQSELIE